MAVPLFLLPLLLAGADPTIVTVGSHERVEQVLSDGIRARVAAGWDVLDTRTFNDEFVVTVRKADAIEKHIIHFDRQRTYRIESASSAPTDPNEPSEFLRQALGAPRGGMEISTTCGNYNERPYVIDDEASGEFATTLVARALSTADDITGVSNRNGRIVFTLRKKTVERELLVWIDRKGRVIEAQLRRFEDTGGGATYRRLPELKRALGRTRVVSVVDYGSTLALLTPTGKFVLDPKGTAFDYSELGDESCGC
jgi:hypothetical protein